MAIHPAPHTRRADPPTTADGPGATRRSAPRSGWPTSRPDDPGGEGRPALRRLGGRRRGRRRSRPAPERHGRRGAGLRRADHHAASASSPAPFGTAPVDPGRRRPSRWPPRSARIAAASRFGIPALAHEECLAGFTAWGATAYPVPLAWGASFDPELVAEMGAPHRPATCARSASTRASPRCWTWSGTRAGAAWRRPSARTRTWSRTVGTAYVRGLESAGIVATLKHFAGLLGLGGRPQPRPGPGGCAGAGRRDRCRRSRWRCATAAPAR